MNCLHSVDSLWRFRWSPGIELRCAPRISSVNCANSRGAPLLHGEDLRALAIIPAAQAIQVFAPAAPSEPCNSLRFWPVSQVQHLPVDTRMRKSDACSRHAQRALRFAIDHECTSERRARGAAGRPGRHHAAPRRRTCTGFHRAARGRYAVRVQLPTPGDAPHRHFLPRRVVPLLQCAAIGASPSRAEVTRQRFRDLIRQYRSPGARVLEPQGRGHPLHASVRRTVACRQGLSHCLPPRRCRLRPAAQIRRRSGGNSRFKRARVTGPFGVRN